MTVMGGISVGGSDVAAVAEGFCWYGHRMVELDEVERMLADRMADPSTGYCDECGLYFGLYQNGGATHASKSLRYLRTVDFSSVTS